VGAEGGGGGGGFIDALKNDRTILYGRTKIYLHGRTDGRTDGQAARMEDEGEKLKTERIILLRGDKSRARTYHLRRVLFLAGRSLRRKFMKPVADSRFAVSVYPAFVRARASGESFAR